MNWKITLRQNKYLYPQPIWSYDTKLKKIFEMSFSFIYFVIQSTFMNLDLSYRPVTKKGYGLPSFIFIINKKTHL